MNVRTPAHEFVVGAFLSAILPRTKNAAQERRYYKPGSAKPGRATPHVSPFPEED